MTELDYPALFRSAEELSARMQARFFRVIYWHLASLVVAVVLSEMDFGSKGFALLEALVLIVALGCSIYLFALRPDRYWYSARAVAESIKTATWRFISCAEPFNNSTSADSPHFAKVLQSIVEQNIDVSRRLSTYLDGAQLSAVMIDRRNASFADRLRFYVEKRVDEQQSWYASKAQHNDRRATVFFAVQILVTLTTIAFAMARVGYPTVHFWPTEILVTIAIGVLTWIQSRRFAQLAGSYALAAHEISLIRVQASTIVSDEQFSRFVGDAENAFSREHTQWVARKDE